MKSIAEVVINQYSLRDFKENLIEALKTSTPITDSIYDEGKLNNILWRFCNDENFPEKDILFIFESLHNRGYIFPPHFIFSLITYGRYETLNYALSTGYDINSVCPIEGGNSLFYMFDVGLNNRDDFPSRFDKAIQMGIKYNITDNVGRNLFHVAFSGRIIEEVYIDKLLPLDIDINKKDNLGWTPLHYWARNCMEISILEKLLKRGADIRIRTGKDMPMDDFGSDMPFIESKNAWEIIDQIYQRLGVWDNNPKSREIFQAKLDPNIKE